MAQRRMFSKTITNSARFLKMPKEVQNLYFHLCMHADDDGVVEAFTVMQILGTEEDSVKLLAAKGFVRPLNEDLVAYIIDWNEHNLIRADRKIDSIYKELLLQVIPEVELTDPKPRADTKKLTGGRPLDNQWTAQERIGEVSLGKVSKGENCLSFLEKLPEEIKSSLSEKYFISPKGIQSKATDLLLYCRQKGKTYKDYKAFLENAIRKDKVKLQNEYPLMVKTPEVNEVELSAEQIEENKKRIAKISQGLATKFKM